MTAAWDFRATTCSGLPGVSSVVGYRAIDVPGSIHAGLPSSQLTFILSLDDGVQASFERTALHAVTPKRVLLAGLHTRPSHVVQGTGQAGVQLSVHPLAARMLFGMPAAAIAEIDVDGSELWGSAAATLADRLSDPNLLWDSVFAALGSTLREKIGSSRQIDVRSELRHAWALLEGSHGRMPIAVVAQMVGVSTRHVTTLFRDEVGVPPKTVARLLRFEHVVQELGRRVRAGQPVELAAMADRAGYADQAHLTREFSGFAGVTPTRWLREEFRNLQDGGHQNTAPSADE